MNTWHSTLLPIFENHVATNAVTVCCVAEGTRRELGKAKTKLLGLQRLHLQFLFEKNRFFYYRLLVTSQSAQVAFKHISWLDFPGKWSAIK